MAPESRDGVRPRRRVCASGAGRATFFLIGKPVSEHPELVRQIAAAGHSIGHHTWSHHNLRVMKPEEAADEIDKGIAAVEMAQNGDSTQRLQRRSSVIPAS
jgi:peptidoglycan/xylan/chitin deacetylase (PgdA/CDA1 family)